MLNKGSIIGIVFCCIGILVSGILLTYIKFFSPQNSSIQNVKSDELPLSGDEVANNTLTEQSNITDQASISSNPSLDHSILFIGSDGFMTAHPVFLGQLTDKNILESLLQTDFQVADNFDSALTNFSSLTNKIEFNDAFVFIDVDQNLTIVDKSIKSIVFSTPCPIFSTSNAYTYISDDLKVFFVLQGKDGLFYIWQFLSDLESIQYQDISMTKDDSDSQKILNTYFFGELGIKNRLMPSKDAEITLLDKLQNWKGSSFDGHLPDPVIYVFDKKLSVNSLSLFALVPEVQGNYTLGLCDENGAWVTMQAFTAVFTDSGEMRAVSIDYVSDKPQVTLHLSDQEIYYVVTDFFVDNGIISENETEDSFENESSPIFFTVKKAI